MKKLLFIVLIANFISCQPEPKTAVDQHNGAVENVAEKPSAELIKSLTQAEGKAIGVINNELRVLDKEQLALPRVGDTSVVTIFLIRHAETLNGRTSLSPEGIKRAGLLNRNFGGAKIAQIYAEGNAAMQTTMMCSQDNKSELSLVKNEGNDILTKTILKNFKGKKVMVAASPKMITDILGQLAGPDKYAIASEEYDNVFIAFAKDLGDSEIHHFKY